MSNGHTGAGQSLRTIIGLLTIRVLNRDSAKELFLHGDIAFQPDQEDE